MKKEQFFRLLGELDDRFLEKYRQMDLRLSHKAYRKKRTLRVVLIAACLALLIGACVPVGMMAHPAGRAILQGDSQALTEQLNRIEGFKPWQEQTAEKLEQSLSPVLWESLQKTPVINVLTQSQYPDYAFKSMQYGAYLDEPAYLTYGFADSVGDYFPDRVDIDVYGEEYQDVNAPSNCPPPPGSSLEEGQVLPYRYSIPQTLYMQAVHVYELRVDKVRNTVYMDAQTGECVYWEISKASSHSPTVADEQTMIDAAYDILSQNVRDPEAYTLSTDRNDYYFICRYNRCIGDLVSCDGLTVRFDLAGNVISVDMAYLGALRYLAEIPQELIDKVTVYMEQTVAGCIESETNIDNITVLSDGRIALACHMEVEYYDSQSDTRQGDATWFLACLTEPVEGHGDLGVTSHTESETTTPDSGKVYGNGLRIWDAYHPDDSERSSYFSVFLAEFDNAVVERREGSEIYADGEKLIGGPGYHCSSFYLSDLTGDGYRELCFCMGCGSGMTDMRIVIIDFTTKETIFTMENRGYNDYYLFLRDGVLCVKETKYRENDAVRTGVLTYDGSKISIAWDSEVNATVDRDHAPVPGEPVN
jgi:hypothetical protein